MHAPAQELALSQPERIARFRFAAGAPLTEGTIRLLLATLRREYTHPRIRARARQLFADLEPMDFDGEIRAVWEWVTDPRVLRYMRDPVGVEHITTPERLDREIDEGGAAEDCESIVLYAATLLAAAGIKSELVAIGYDPRKPEHFRHLMMYAIHPTTGERIAFDPTAAQRFAEWNLGDTIERPGWPSRAWSLDGARVMPRPGTLADCAFGDVNLEDVIDVLTRGVGGAASLVVPEYGGTINQAGALARQAFKEGTQGSPQVPTGPIEGADGIVRGRGRLRYARPGARPSTTQRALSPSRAQALTQDPNAPASGSSSSSRRPGLSTGAKVALGIGAGLLARSLLR